MRGDAEFDPEALIAQLVGGDKGAWGQFVDRFSPVIYGAILKYLRRSARNLDEAGDVAQDVFVKLCRNDFRVLRRYDPTRAKLSTWLTVIATTTTIDHLRRRRQQTVPLDDMPETVASVKPVVPGGITIPKGLLTARQLLVMRLLYDKDMDPGEVGAMLSINAQTVRSTHHKALMKLRKFFEDEENR
ncbi:MAG: sigma-70 family RNA polymerase sigma factor [Alphaproteobacteria bacterium]